jgi:2-dehydro-3-deoxyphosphooctonate aldolase (KDO 8-P synthase)
VIYDVTHSLQRPGGGPGNPDSAESGGERRFALPLARAAVAAGADGLFLEVHPDPPRALSDSAVQLTPAAAEALLRSAAALRQEMLREMLREAPA